ncbi:CU044_5270 family protein [Nonomuraea sp. NPDC050643]|uniref:CU044_5270 family protein n=1 Tax=Nonomuraea sp. NPDC050643 TaxID=3155660 RepID=UPI0033C5AE27
MDDLREIRTLLAKPDPSPEAVTRRRRQLRSSMHRPAPRRRARWFLVPVVAAATAAAVAIVPGRLGGSPPPPPPSASASAPSNAREVLLVAATSAERAPEGSGTYWHITVTQEGRPPQEYWYRRDGQFWLKGAGLKGEGRLLRFTRKPELFAVGALRMTFDELRALPDEADALYTRLRSAIAERGLRTSAGPATDAQQDGFAVETLLSLISQAPVSPQVRAAAYRALATRPGVVDLGETEGGRRLEIPLAVGKGVVVVDPETARVRNTPVWAPLTGGIAFSEKGVTIDAEWTERLPAE